ncbi:Nucleoplasmin-like domain [Dillenia turbinata]|uniref:peptidylprolyl isomerase n=1 Tax=Dillenia turbinata TaxID=194707 RepID=A0AAN8VY46_9MAGN
MAFWGVEVKPGKPYSHSFEDAPGRIHLTQATLGSGSSTKKSTVQCQVGDKDPIYLCTLLPDRTESCPLNLEFEEDEIVTFSIIGQQSIHLSGIYLGAGHDAEGDDYYSDSYEDIEGTDTDESTDYNSEEDEYDDDFIDDSDAHMFPPSPVPNSGVVIEEIVDDEKPANSSKPKHAKQGQNNEEGNTDWQIIAKSGTGVPVLESEDEDGFPISSPAKSKSSVQKTEIRAEKNVDKVNDINKAKEDVTNLKRKVDHILQDGKPERTTEEVKNHSHSSDEFVPEIGIEGKKEKKKSKKTKNGEKVHEGNISSDKPGTKIGDTATEHDEKPNDDNGSDAQQANGDDSEKKKKKKKKKKTKTLDSEADATLGQNVTDKDTSSMEIEEKTESQPSKTRTFPNGLVIEELAMVKPDGKRASPGKKVSVRYVGKLKKNGQIFDSNIGRAPFKFRLGTGIGQVIKGWDVGVNGMRVGDKRRLTIPPSMGYGASGAGSKIPPNSWLVFDVELIDAKGLGARRNFAGNGSELKWKELCEKTLVIEV